MLEGEQLSSNQCANLGQEVSFLSLPHSISLGSVLTSPLSAPSPNWLHGNSVQFFFFFNTDTLKKKQTLIFKEACNFAGDRMFIATICLVLIPFYFASRTKGCIVGACRLFREQRGDTERQRDASRNYDCICLPVWGCSGPRSHLMQQKRGMLRGQDDWPEGHFQYSLMPPNKRNARLCRSS